MRHGSTALRVWRAEDRTQRKVTKIMVGASAVCSHMIRAPEIFPKVVNIFTARRD